MAPTSPRRSSRARPTQSQSAQSSSSSAASVRQERATRSLNKPSSGQSTPSASLSSETLDDLEDTLLGRRRRRAPDDQGDKTPKVDYPAMANVVDDLQDEEDEAVRCLCGTEDYPGRPPVQGSESDLFAAIELTEDVTGFFVQCDICKVWQHGACVGIFSAESSPDEYFCELCRKDLHKIYTASNGQKYSKYLPLHRSSRAPSRATSGTKDGTRSPQNGPSKTPSHPNSALQTAKRRSTMNSRDAAYDDELLQRVIEASKEDVAHETTENGSSRRPKRGRSGSEEQPSTVKRQRTGSRSASLEVEQPDTSAIDASSDETMARNASKKCRSHRSVREKDEKEDKERQRQDAASKRKGRAERRRAEDSDHSEETPLAASKAAQINKGSEAPSAEESVVPPQPVASPPTSHPVTTNSHKKGGKSNKKGKGKNQYTKDRDMDGEEAKARSSSRDLQKPADEATQQNKSATGDSKHSSKGKQTSASKLSMHDMKRRVAAIMDFISRTQVDLAAENGSSNSDQGSPPETETSQTNGDCPSDREKRPGSNSISSVNSTDSASFGEKGFKELSCVEMMDVLTRDMVKWQNQYA
ncbi:hypothetical protein CDD81_1063 [Ophiocordyceps australis]|uniref:Zinc finger PHD-type domain-containing protein n=1 Tax=Ophiocordyceps australis TaxID=1399860 RepID=A0A2C5Y110_9HYPO|nr:hypothetical protein CDD81_1063 [Ophiocordyceps australis]